MQINDIATVGRLDAFSETTRLTLEVSSGWNGVALLRSGDTLPRVAIGDTGLAFGTGSAQDTYLLRGYAGAVRLYSNSTATPGILDIGSTTAGITASSASQLTLRTGGAKYWTMFARGDAHGSEPSYGGWLYYDGASFNTVLLSNGSTLGIGGSPGANKLKAYGSIESTSQLISTVATGTAPFVVSSTTLVSNLNVDMVDGYHASDFSLATHNHDTHYLKLDGSNQMSGPLWLSNTGPRIVFYESDGTANNRRFDLRSTADTFWGTLYSDDGSTSSNWLGVYRSGNTVTGVDITGTTINLVGTTVRSTGSTSTEDALRTLSGRIQVGQHTGGSGVWLDRSSSARYWFLGLDGGDSTTLRFYNTGAAANVLSLTNSGSMYLNGIAQGMDWCFNQQTGNGVSAGDYHAPRGLMELLWILAQTPGVPDTFRHRTLLNPEKYNGSVWSADTQDWTPCFGTYTIHDIITSAESTAGITAKRVTVDLGTTWRRPNLILICRPYNQQNWAYTWTIEKSLDNSSWTSVGSRSVPRTSGAISWISQTDAGQERYWRITITRDEAVTSGALSIGGIMGFNGYPSGQSGVLERAIYTEHSKNVYFTKDIDVTGIAKVSSGTTPSNMLQVGPSWVTTSLSWIAQGLRLKGDLWIHDAATPANAHYLNSASDGKLTLFTSGSAGSHFSAARYTSTVATGTAPFVVTSTTMSANLNADLLDGQHGSYYATITNQSGLSSGRLVGRYSAGTGAVQEIVVSTGLNLDSSGNLTATGLGVTDHGVLTGLGDDDHTQYHNDARGDARYLQLTGGTVSGTLTLTGLGTDYATISASNRILILDPATNNVRKSTPDFVRGMIDAAQTTHTHAISAITMNTGKILGRYSPSSGSVQELTIGTGLNLDVSGTLTASGTGSVTSVGLSAPGIFSVSGSPVTTFGTLTLSLASQSNNVVWAGPAVAGTSAPTFRSLVEADIPQLATSKITGLDTALAGKSDVGHTHSYLPLTGGTVSGTLTLTGLGVDYETASSSNRILVLDPSTNNVRKSTPAFVRGMIDAAAYSHTHAASDITSGTMATARLGSGTANNTVFLRGDSTWAAVTGLPSGTEGQTLVYANGAWTAIGGMTDGYPHVLVKSGTTYTWKRLIGDGTVIE